MHFCILSLHWFRVAERLIKLLRDVHEKEFVGAESFEFGVNVIAQARQYVEEMVRIRARDGDGKLFHECSGIFGVAVLRPPRYGNWKLRTSQTDTVT